MNVHVRAATDSSCVLACAGAPRLRSRGCMREPETGAAHRHQRLDRQRAALPGARARPPRSRVGAARRVSVGERGAARVSQPGDRRHGDQPRRAVRARRRTACSRGSSWSSTCRTAPTSSSAARGMRTMQRSQGQVGRGGKRRARRVRAEPGAGAQRHAGERRQRRAPRVERAAERVRERARSMAPSRSTRIAPSSCRPARRRCSTARRFPARSSTCWRCARACIDKQPKAMQALLAGWFSAIDYMKRDPKDAARRMGIRQQTTGEQFLEALAGPAHSVARRKSEDARRRDAGAGGDRTPADGADGGREAAARRSSTSRSVLAPGRWQDAMPPGCNDHPRSGVAQAHGPARSCSASPRRSARSTCSITCRRPSARRRRTAASAWRRRCRACRARSSTCCSRATSTAAQHEIAVLAHNHDVTARRADRRPQRRHRRDAARVARTADRRRAAAVRSRAGRRGHPRAPRRHDAPTRTATSCSVTPAS